MEKISATLTVLFEDPFWVGVFERRYDDKIEVAKVTFEKSLKIMRFMTSFCANTIT